MVDGDTCTQLRSDSDQFWSDLQLVDSMSTRTADTMYVYYVRHGQFKASEILANNSSTSLPSDYFSLLSSLGWQVDLSDHTGWLGVGATKSVVSSSGKMLYWGDVTTELTILTP